MSSGDYDLQRFVRAQEDVYSHVVDELRAGAKASHWMWFVFPQVAGLGSSSMAQRYAISGLDEARLYLTHPVLGPRLRECTRLMLAVEGKTSTDILGGIDGLKFRSSMTLFAHAAPDETLFRDALEKFYSGEEDPRTLELLETGG